MANAGAAERSAIDAPVAAFWKSSLRPMRMAVDAVAGRTTEDTRGAGTTNPLTAVRHSTRTPKNFIVSIWGGEVAAG